MILYGTRVDGTNHEMGTSGFLFRSNKLMYDQATQSLWSTLWGRPVIGPLVGKGIELERMSVVTTTWGEWRRRHPDTKVLSPFTGHFRDYSEGAAYRQYFATDEVMFPVPHRDDRLLNKAEVLALQFAGGVPVAVSAEFLERHPVWYGDVGWTRVLVLTDRSGANRVYEAGDVVLESWDQDAEAVDAAGVRWAVTEAAVVHPDGRRLERLPAHRAFWFGWRAAFPDTRLVK